VTPAIPARVPENARPFVAASRGGAADQHRLRQPATRRRLNPGETVLYLGSGGGIDVQPPVRQVERTGRARGINSTDETLKPARRNAAPTDATYVKVPQGHI
jgi:cyclopropane fatty-acyl-phospholipid synthase-like methyltransferase